MPDERMVDCLPDEAVVIRGGKMGSQNLFEHVQTTHGEIGKWAMCVASYPNYDADEIANEMPYRGKHIMASTVGRLRNEGFEVIPDYDPEGGYVHALIELPVDPADDPGADFWESMWEKLRGCFNPPQSNPAYESRR